jgi:tetratricopeptide (TPR) repeat protein
VKESEKVLLCLFIIVFINSCYNKVASQETVSSGKSQSDYIDGLLERAEYFERKNGDSALFYVGLAIESAEKSNNLISFGKMYLRKGNILYIHNKYSEAKQLFLKSLGISKKTDDKLLKAKSLERLASVYFTTGNLPVALNYYMKSLLLFEELDNLKGCGKVYNALGVYNYNIGNYTESKSYFNKAIEIHTKLKDTLNIIENNVNKGWMFIKSGEFDSAEILYDNLLPVIGNMNDSLSLSVSYYNLASLNIKKGLIEAGLDYYNKAINLFKAMNDTSFLINIYTEKGSVLYSLEQIDSAVFYLQKSVEFSRALKNMKMEKATLEILADIYRQDNNLKNECNVFRRISVLQDSICNNQLKHNLKTSELTYKNAKQQQIITLQQELLSTTSAKKRLFVILLLVLCLILVLLNIIIVTVKKSHSKTKKLHLQEISLRKIEKEKAEREKELKDLEHRKMEDELSSKNRQLVSTAILIEQNQKTLESLKKELLKVEQKYQGESIPEAELNKLKKLIELKLIDTQNWDLFKTHFDKSYKDFFVKLKSKHPALTKTELGFCSYLRINLSSKQIASILSVSNDTIYKTRYKIRKKMNLKQEDSLEDYLLTF